MRLGYLQGRIIAVVGDPRMNRAQRRQTARTAKQARKKGVAPPVAANLTSDVIRDMEAAVGFHQTGELTRAAGLY